MADKDHPNGRMLFTDFDASDKGRPVAVFDGNAAQAVHELPQSAVRSLDALAAVLELDFEDDGDGAPPPPPLFRPPEKQTPEESAADKTEAPAPAAPAPPSDDDPELVLEEMERLTEIPGIHAAPPATEAPSWDALASAYEQALPIMKEPLSGGGGDGRDQFPAFAPPARGDDGVDDGIDVLSMLDEYLERENRPPAFPPDSPAAEDAFPEPRPVPYGGVERVSDWFAPPEDQPEPFPRIEDWFSPPEDQPEQPLRVEDWYEPPEPGEEEWDDRDDPGVDISWLSDFQNELPVDEYWRKKTTRITKVDDSAAALLADADVPPDAPPPAPAGKVVKPRHPAADTAELFADMDINRLWEQNVASKQQSLPAPDSETRRISLFDDINVDSLWDKKQDADSKRAQRTNASSPAAGGTTVIVPQGALDAAGTVILRDGLEEIDAGSPSPRSAPAKEAAPPPASAAQPRTPDEKRTTAVAERSVPAASGASAPAAPAGEAGGAGFDGRMIDGDRLDSDAGDGEGEYVARTPPADPSGENGAPADDLLNSIDVDSLADGADGVSAPVIDDSAIDEIPAGTRSNTDEMRAVAEGDPVAVNPMDVFADMDNMDFSDDVDDEMRALLEDEEGEGAEADAATADAHTDAAEEAAEIIPATRLGRAWHSVSKLSRRFFPMRFVDKAMAMIAWRENWWFYCDLVAAVVASASLAVIISYFFWYRGV